MVAGTKAVEGASFFKEGSGTRDPSCKAESRLAGCSQYPEVAAFSPVRILAVAALEGVAAWGEAHLKTRNTQSQTSTNCYDFIDANLSSLESFS